MLHGKRMVLLVYLHLTLVVQYNIILIIVKSIYTILLFANKQWGYIQINEDGLYPLPIAFTKWYTGVASPDVKIGGIIGVGCSNMSKIELSTTIESYKRYIAIGL